MDAAPRHPVRLVVTDDLVRSRLTVFFRILLALPHFLWLGLWLTVAFVVTVVNWFATLITGRSPSGIHDFLAGFLRYATHVEAYVLLAANPYPAFFVGSASPYPVDLEIDPPVRQNRWKTGFRVFLALPAAMLAGALLGSFAGQRSSVGVAGTAAFLMWFAALARARAPRGLHDITCWGIGYAAQASAYMLLLTDRYPYTGPEQHLTGLEPPDAPGRPRLADSGDLRRSRLTVFLRLPLLFPHLVWWLGWSIVAIVLAPFLWIATLAMGRPPRPLARFVAAYVRYTAHLTAFGSLVGNPFPGFVGREASYPVDVRIEPAGRQSRWVTAFRLVLAIPAWLVGGAVGGVLFVGALLGWFVGLVKGELPAGLQSAGAYAVGYNAQVNAYSWLLTDRYPHASPQAVVEAPDAPEQPLDSTPPGAFV